jgi:rsbT co-antagonist protein RsbR
VPADVGAARRLVALLRSHEQTLLSRWTDGVIGSAHGLTTRNEIEQGLREVYSALVGALESVGMRALTDDGFAELRSVLTELSHARARRGLTPSETAASVFALKGAILDVLGQEEAEDLRADFNALSKLVDDLGLFTFEAYTQAREQIIINQAEQLLELSTPVVKLWDGVLAVPLVGTLDSARTEVVMEKLLQAFVDTGSAYAILDITGVLAVDTQVAQHLLKTVVAARLMGAECIVSGIRPQIAQTIVTLGIEFGDIATKASLADALVHALSQSGFDVVPRTARQTGR